MPMPGVHKWLKPTAYRAPSFVPHPKRHASAACVGLALTLGAEHNRALLVHFLNAILGAELAAPRVTDRCSVT